MKKKALPLRIGVGAIILNNKKTDTITRAKSENLCCTPFFKKAERIAMPTSSLLVSIFHNPQLLSN